MRIIKIKNLLILKIFNFLTKKQKNLLFIILLLICFGAVLELISVLIIIPFVNLLIGEDLPQIATNIFLLFNINLDKFMINDLILFTGILVLSTSLFSSSYRILLSIIKEKYISKIINFLSTLAFTNIINQRYSWHLKHESSELIVKLDCIDNISSRIIGPLLVIFTSLISSIIILTGMLIYDPFTTFISIFLVSIIYYLIIIWCKNRLDINALGRIEERKKVIKLMKDSFSGIRELIMNNESDFVIKPYSISDKKLRNFYAEAGYLGICPKYLVEFLAILMIIIIGISTMSSTNKTDTVITALAFFSFSLLKIIPHVQSFYSSITSIRANKRSLTEFIELLSLNNFYPNKKHNTGNNSIYELLVSNISFKYSTNKEVLFRNLSLKFSKGDFIVLTGKSGSGKTTLSDLLMGLIEPDSGEYFFKYKTNKLKINSFNLRESSVHVPQEVFLFSDSLINNILRGSPLNKILLEKALYASCLDEFIYDLPNGMNTQLGERGALVSGGQRQRIGLARAIYKILIDNKFLLFLDESTSALDTITEKEVILRLKKILKNKIIIAISHRENTFSLFNRVINLNLLSKTKENLENK